MLWKDMEMDASVIQYFFNQQHGFPLKTGPWSPYLKFGEEAASFWICDTHVLLNVYILKDISEE